MSITEWLGVTGFCVSIIVNLLGVIKNWRRGQTQSAKDEVEALQVAMKIAGMDLQEQLKLKEEVQKLKNMVEGRGYRVQVCFYPGGDQPMIENVVVENISRDSQATIMPDNMNNFNKEYT